mgnify:CR=1 FL=1
MAQPLAFNLKVTFTITFTASRSGRSLLPPFYAYRQAHLSACPAPALQATCMPPDRSLRSASDRTLSQTTPSRAGAGVVVAASGVASDLAANECRCLCGSLLARWLEDGLELKCRRCKRVIVVARQEHTA